MAKLRTCNVIPIPWRYVGLTVLPGFILLALTRLSSPDPLAGSIRIIALAVAILMVISSVVPAVVHRSLLNMQAWGLIPSGFLAGIAAGLGLFALTGTLDNYLVCFVALGIAALVYAQRFGLSAGLFVLPGGTFIASSYIEPGMYFADTPISRLLTGDGMILLFWILMPAAVLRSRSILGQALGLLLPIVGYAAAFVFALSKLSGLAQPFFELSVRESISIATPFIALFIIVVMAAPLYLWLYARSSERGKR